MIQLLTSRRILLIRTGLLVLFFGWMAAAAHTAHAQDGPRSISVALYDEYAPEEVVVEGHDSPLLIFAGTHDEPLRRVAAGTPVTITLQRDQLYLEMDDDGGIYALSLNLRTVDSDKAFGVTLPDGPGQRTYYGLLTLETSDAASAIRLVNDLDLETYVACVLGSEYGLDDLEGTKAMAVAIRTYALHPRDDTHPSGTLSDTRQSQVYRGAEFASDRNFEAARATRGQVLTHSGQMIDATYFSSSGGFTTANENVWRGEPKPYLRAQADPYDAVSPYQHWRQTIDRDRVLEILSDAVPGRATGFVIDRRDDGGRVKTISVLRRSGSARSMNAARFRTLINRHLGPLTLKSTFFEASRQGSQYVFEGKGFGHGVGMSQWGAHGMAKKGYSYKEILSFYYPGTRITHVGEAISAPLVADRTTTSPATDSGGEAPDKDAAGDASATAAETDGPSSSETAASSAEPQASSGTAAESANAAAARADNRDQQNQISGEHQEQHEPQVSQEQQPQRPVATTTTDSSRQLKTWTSDGVAAPAAEAASDRRIGW